METGKLIKKLLCVVLSLTMIFSSASLVASAINAEEDTSVQESVATDNEKDDAEEPEEDATVQDQHFVVERSDGKKMAFTVTAEGGCSFDDNKEAADYLGIDEDEFFSVDFSPMAEPDAGTEEPEAEPMFSFGDEYKETIVDLYKFVLTHNQNEKIYDKISGEYIYGVKDIVFVDSDADYRCDTCGMCIFGCTDGTVVQYDKTTDPNGEHIIKETITNTTTGETEEVEYYDSYVVGDDGICDICSTPICDYSHVYGNGICDSCGRCIEYHIDADANGVCDRCKMCIANHVDADADNKCDLCNTDITPCVHLTEEPETEETETEETEETEEPAPEKIICDICGLCLKDHVDTDSDGVCDECKTCVSGVHTDADLNDICDLCGNEFMPCSHEDKNTVCSKCIIDYCGGANAYNVISAYGWVNSARQYIIENVNSDFNDYDSEYNALSETYMTFIDGKTAKEDIDATKALIDAYSKTLDELKKTDASELVSSGSEGAVMGIYKAVASALDEISEKAEDENASSLVKHYYSNYYSLDGSVAGAKMKKDISKLSYEILDTQLDNILGENYETGKVTVTRENKFEIRKKANAFNEDLYAFLYTSEEAIESGAYKAVIAKAPDMAQKVWEGKASLSSIGSDELRLVVKYSLISYVRGAIQALATGTFTNYDKTKEQINTVEKYYDSEVGEYYAVREKMEGDIAREDDDKYYVTEDTTLEMVRKIDEFVTSGEFLQLIGIEDAESIYDYAISMIEKMLCSNETLNGVVSMVFPMICKILDGGLEDIVNGLSASTFPMEMKNGKIEAELGDAWDFLMTNVMGFSSTVAKVTKYLAIDPYGTALEVYLNGANGTSKLRTLLLDEVGLAVYPNDVANRIKAFDKDGRLKKVTDELSGKQSWDDVDIENLDWGIQDLDTLKYAAAGLLTTLEKVVDWVFDINNHLSMKLTKVAKAQFMAVFAGFYPLNFSMPFTLDIDVGQIDIYGQLIVPIFEALGVNQVVESSNNKDLKYSFIEHKGKAKSTLDVVDMILDPVLVLVEQIAANPVEKILSIVPNLMLYIQEGFIPELLDISMKLNKLELRFVGDSDNILPSIVTILSAVILAPAAVLLLIPIVGKILYGIAVGVVALALAAWAGLQIFLAAGFDLSGSINKGLDVGSILTQKVMEMTKDMFDITDVRSILKYAIKQTPFAELADVVNLINFDAAGYLGNIEKRTDSGRSKTVSAKYNLNEGEYYFVKADIGDVIWFFLDTVCDILQNKEAFGKITETFGVNLDDLQAVVDGMNLSQYGLDISIGDTIEGLSAEKLLVVAAEFILPSGDYGLESIEWEETDSETAEEIESKGDIPYLEYDNDWNKDMADLITGDLEGLVNQLLPMLDEQLGLKEKLGVEDISSLSAIVHQMADTLDYNEIVTKLLGALNNISSMLGENADLVTLMTELDLSGWSNDFGYLFAEAKEPENAVFPLLKGEKSGEKITWTYDGEKLESLSDITEALGYILTPLDKVLDLVLAGRDLGVAVYTKESGEKGSVVTVKGTEGYNYALIPLLEVIGVDEEKILTQAEFNAYGSTSAALMYSLNLIIDKVFEIIDSGRIVEELTNMLYQMLYFAASNGVGTVLNDMIHPVFVLIDILRPVIDIDINKVINTVLCNFTYKIGGFENSEEMMKALKSRNALFSIDNLSTDSLLSLAGVVLSAEKDGERVYLSADEVMNAAVNDISYLRESYASKSVDENGSFVTGYRLKTDGGDSLTVFISLLVEVLLDGENPYIIDSIIGMPGIVETAAEVLAGIEWKYSTAYNWAYILGSDATKEEKAELLAKIKADGSVNVEDYLTAQAKADFDKYLSAYDITTWDEGTAIYLVTKIGSIVDTVLNIETEDGLLGDTIMGLVGSAEKLDKYDLSGIINVILPSVLNDETIDNVLALISDFINGRENDAFKAKKSIHDGGDSEIEKLSKMVAQNKDLILKLSKAIGVDLSAYDIDASRTVNKNGKVTYYNAEGEKTGLERVSVSEDGKNIGLAIADILKPLESVLAWALLGDNLEFFNTTGAVDGKERRDSLVNVEGLELYEYVLIPLLEALGVRNLKTTDEYKSEGIDALMHDVLDKTIAAVLAMLDGDSTQAVLDNIFDVVPALLYYLNSDALAVVLQNTAGQVDMILDIYNEKSGKQGEEKLSVLSLLNSLAGFEFESYSDVTLVNIIKMISITDDDEKYLDYEPEDIPTYNIYINEFVQRVLEEFVIGEIYYNDSAATYDTYSMRYSSAKDKAATITIIAGVALDIIEDEDNAPVLTYLLGKEAYESVINILNLNDFNFEMQDFTWLFKEYADTDTLLSAFDFSSLFDVDPYAGRLWTREMAAELAENLTQFINDMLYLLGLEFNGIKISDFNTLMYALLGGSIYSDDLLGVITSLLGQIKPLLDKYDPDGAIAGFVKELLDVDLHAWDDYAEGGKYADGREWGFTYTKKPDSASVRANSKVFENALCELLSPLSRLLTFVLCENDITFFTEGDGLGKNTDDIQLTIYGAEGYKYAIVPLLEAMNVDGSPEDLVNGKRDGDIYNPDEFSKRAVNDNMYAIEGVVHPIVSKLNDIMDSTATEILEIIPSIVYFINSNGIDTVVKNLLHSVYMIGNAIRPVGEQIDMVVYDEYGINLYKTIDLEGIIENTLYGAIGITKEDVAEIYKTSGKETGAVDGLEDIDFRLLFSIGLAAVNKLLSDNGIPFKFTSIAASAIEELTYGYVRSFSSLSGRTAYTMILGKEINRYCYGDLLSILMRIVLKFLSVDGNAKALTELIKLKFSIADDDAYMLSLLLNVFAWYTGTLGAYEVVMLTLYYTVYGASKASGAGVEVYDNVNYKWAGVITKLQKLDNPIAREVIRIVIEKADSEAGDVIGSEGIAANGFIRFFQKIIEWFKAIFAKIKSAFK